MTREALLAEYDTLRAATQRVVEASLKAFSRAEEQRAARSIAGPLWKKAVDNDRIFPLVADLALFEPDSRGRRVFDRFVAAQERRPTVDPAIVQQMRTAWFSIFKIVDRHETAGVWVEDMAKAGQRLHVMDRNLERTATMGSVVGLRVFNVGRYLIALCVAANGGSFFTLIAEGKKAKASAALSAYLIEITHLMPEVMISRFHALARSARNDKSFDEDDAFEDQGDADGDLEAAG